MKLASNKTATRKIALSHEILSNFFSFKIQGKKSSRSGQWYFPENICSARHMFRAIFVPLSVTKILEKPLRSGSFLVNFGTSDLQCYWKWTPGQVFFKENSYSNREFTKRLFFIIINLHLIFRIDVSQLLFLDPERKFNKIINEN